ncbi:glycosyltransferase family 1 protein [Microbacterium sp. HMWF026]|uniref:glycosyltransferase family 4 protein n=1 Tax=Microbacterium sp. HMWF026 TaxID=2056861 RepID=UPI0011B27C66|nr:glycosyltransferase family 1 protein [Microbacterium sp. HMWF026]
MADGRKTAGEATGVGHYEQSLFTHLQDIANLRILTGAGFGFHLRGIIETLRSPRAVYFSPESLIVPIFLGRRSMLTIHDLTPLLYPERHTLRNRLFHRLFLRAAVRRVGAILVPTNAVARDVTNHFGGRAQRKTHVIYEGVRFDVSRIVNTAEREKIILYVGTIEPRKNVSLMCRAFARAKRDAPDIADWRLVIVGKRGWLSADETADLDEALMDAGAEELGYQPNDYVQWLYANASVFCYVSEAEGFGLPPLEAMAHGTPVIVSDDAALTEVAEGAGIVVKRGESMEKDLAAQIVRLTQENGMRADMHDRGLQRAGLFTWEEAARRSLAVAAAITGNNE